MQDTAKPPSSNLTLGDSRINPFITSYSQDFDSPFVGGRTLRSPLRNKNLGSVADLKEVYSSAFQRVGEYVIPFPLSRLPRRPPPPPKKFSHPGIFQRLPFRPTR